MKIIFKSLDGLSTEYGQLIEQFTKFEIEMEINSIDEKVNYLAELFIGSRNTRQGTRPTIEQQAMIIQVIRHYVELDLPISVLIPSGPKKSKNGESVDLAELSVIKILKCLNESAKKVYAPGFNFHIRLEDYTGRWLEGDNAMFSIEKYMQDFINLNTLIGDPSIYFFMESSLTDWEDYESRAKYFTEIIEKYIVESNNTVESAWNKLESYNDLLSAGWKGMIPLEMREYLISKYQKLYPEYSKQPEFYTHMMAKYLGGTIARHRCKIRTPWIEGIKYLEIGFALPTPGIPEGMQSTRVYYRSVTLKNSKHNIPFWRAKGILKIDKHDHIRISLLSWNNMPAENNIAQGEITFVDEKPVPLGTPLSVTVKTDIIFE